MNFRMAALIGGAALAASPAMADEIGGESIASAFTRGGDVMWVILAASVAGSVFVIDRLIALRRAAQIPKKLMADFREALVRGGGVEAARTVVQGRTCAIAKALDAILARNGATRRELEAVLEDEGTRILFDLRANTRPIGFVASISPLLGLLGTVFGLIASFRTAAELGMDDPRNFAAGIYEALYTTAFGLVVAIPFLAFYHFLRGRAERILREVEDIALSFIAAASRRAGTAGVAKAAAADPAADAEHSS